METTTIILGSRSPRRLDLLGQLIAPRRVVVCPPVNSEELDFEGLSDWPAIRGRLEQISRSKNEDVRRQILRSPPSRRWGVITADTTIVAQEKEGSLVVLGQPREHADWTSEVRQWFLEYLLDNEHWALTAVTISTWDERVRSLIVTTRVRFGLASRELVDWYLSTEEPRGKAGGYALQGLGSIFVEEVEGSLSNVVGLPLKETLMALKELELVKGLCG